MRKNRISETIGNIDQKYVNEATAYTGEAKTVRRPVWMKWGAIAASFAFVMLIGLGVWQNGLFDGITPTTPNHSHGESNPNRIEGNDNKNPYKTISVISTASNAGEFAADMYRPDGYSENIGSVLALKMNMSDEADEKYPVIVSVPDEMTLEQLIETTNKTVNIPIESNNALLVSIADDTQSAEKYLFVLTANQVVDLATNGAKCLYVGSGNGDPRDVNWDTREGIEIYCEIHGDQYIFNNASDIQSLPDLFLE